jgi:hypothetical protein
VPKRLQRMLIRFQKYDYELSYQPGAQMLIADTLSRAYIKKKDQARDEFEVISMLDCSSIPVDIPIEIRASVIQLRRS